MIGVSHPRLLSHKSASPHLKSFQKEDILFCLSKQVIKKMTAIYQAIQRTFHLYLTLVKIDDVASTVDTLLRESVDWKN